MLARGYVALENIASANVAKQKKDIIESIAKRETIESM
jgi:hypothetical protein